MCECVCTTCIQNPNPNFLRLLFSQHVSVIASAAYLLGPLRSPFPTQELGRCSVTGRRLPQPHRHLHWRQVRDSSSPADLETLREASWIEVGPVVIRADERHHGASVVSCAGCVGRPGEVAGVRGARCWAAKRGTCVAAARRLALLSSPALGSTACSETRSSPSRFPSPWRHWRCRSRGGGSTGALGDGTGRTDGAALSSCLSKDVAMLAELRSRLGRVRCLGSCCCLRALTSGAAK